jgi:hypothetical protein
LAGKPEENRPVRRTRSRWEGNIRMDLRDTVWEAADWILLTQDRDQ